MPARKRSLEDELEALRAGLAGSEGPARDAVLARALESPRALVVTRAATYIRDHALDGLTAALHGAYRRMLTDPVKADPGCKAKHAILEALDFTEVRDPEVFLHAVGYLQEEPVWGGKTDTAVPLRSRALLGLARIGDGDLPLLAAGALADPYAPVRAAAADALAGFGLRAAAGPLLLKLATPDDDPMVTLSCMAALLTLAPDVALVRLGPMLDPGHSLFELSAMALAQCQRADAAQLVLDAASSAVRPGDRALLYRALGLNRGERSAALLLEKVATGPATDARAALAALAPRRFEPGMRARVDQAVKGNTKVDLRAALAEAFPDDSVTA